MCILLGLLVRGEVWRLTSAIFGDEGFFLLQDPGNFRRALYIDRGQGEAWRENEEKENASGQYGCAFVQR